MYTNGKSNNWVNNINKNSSLTQFDIKSFYSTFKENILNNTLNIAKHMSNPNEKIEIRHSRKSILHYSKKQIKSKRAKMITLFQQWVVMMVQKK